MISLSKNQTISLAKESSALSRVQFGLGWDPVKKKKVFWVVCSVVVALAIALIWMPAV